jgi:hypothetical protein
MRALIILMFFPVAVLAQGSEPCKVEVENLTGKYAGECKNGYANGNGEAQGLHRYTGSFRNGLPNGKGVYYYSDSVYHSGSFQDGIKEGKGETHYLRSGMTDSVIRGYWSADEYRGKSYQTYMFSGEGQFDLTEISPSAETGNTITIEISTTSGAPDGTPKSTSGSDFVLTVTELATSDENTVKQVQTYSTASKFSATYQISSFPIKLQATLSNGRTFDLELYKAANWKARLYMNR